MTDYHVYVLAGPEAKLSETSFDSLDAWQWLEEGAAMRFRAAADMPAILRQTYSDRFTGCDVVVRAADAPQIKLLMCDMDSTMIEQECIDEMADMLGIKPKVAEITEHAMRGELDFESALEERVALLKGLPESALQEVFDKRITFSAGAKALVQGMRARGARCVLVSGGFTYFTWRVSEVLGFHDHYANHLKVAGGVLTGEVERPILGKETKQEQLENQCAALGIASEQVLAIGDGANDIPMLQAAGLGVAYRAKPATRAVAAASLDHASLDALLHLM